MDNFTNVTDGYRKEEVNEFVDYVIRKTEENILTIKKQKEEIEALKLENERLKKLEDSYHYIQSQIENTANEIKSNAKYEADLIIREAKENASSIVNDALLRAEKLENDKENLNQSLKMYKRKVKNIDEASVENVYKSLFNDAKEKYIDGNELLGETINVEYYSFDNSLGDMNPKINKTF